MTGIGQGDEGYALRVGWRDLAHLPASATREMRDVAATLERLPPPWQAVHAVPMDGRQAAIDHLAVGPGGVLALSSDENPDAESWAAGIKFMLRVQRRPYISAAGHAARRAAELLGRATGLQVAVTAVLAVPDKRKGFHVRFEDEGVHVVGRRHLQDWIEELPAVLDPAQVDTLHRAARRSDTWR